MVKVSARRSRFGRSRIIAVLCLWVAVASCGGDPEEAPATTTPASATTTASTTPSETTSETSTTVEQSPDDSEIREFYEGNTITIVVGSAPGGGFDTYARLIAKHLPKHIPGSPNVVVENMPGGGNMLAQNHMYNAARNDGTVIGNASASITINQLFGDPEVQFDMRDYLYLGQPDFGGTSVLWASENWEGTLADTLEPGGPELIIGGSAPGSLQYDPAVLLKTVLGANVRVVGGYPGSGELRLALEQGEIDAFFLNWETARVVASEQVESGEWRPLVKYGEHADGHPDAADIPSVYDFVDSQSQRDLLYFGGTGGAREIQRIYYLPPGTPEDRYLALRTAFEATLADPELLAEAEQAQLLIAPLSGEEVHQRITEFLNLPDETVEALRTALERS